MEKRELPPQIQAAIADLLTFLENAEKSHVGAAAGRPTIEEDANENS